MRMVAGGKHGAEIRGKKLLTFYQVMISISTLVNSQITYTRYFHKTEKYMQ